MKNNPAIVVVGFNRPNSLLRLLRSLSEAKYNTTDIPLVLSIDGGAPKGILDICEQFEWSLGKKRVISHVQPLGLRRHILYCGALTKEFGSIILLEDDLMVAPYFYSYSLQALRHCENVPKISGISLFSYQIKEFKHIPFIPLHDGYDNIYLQLPSSWGQIWNRKWWEEFENWINKDFDKTSVRVPEPILSWTKESWKKEFIYYLVANQRYFFYPRISHTTNFGDVGINHTGDFARYQVPLQMGDRKYSFSDFEGSQCIYDAYYELDARNLNLGREFLEFDLYSEKQGYLDETEYVLTTRPVKRSIEKFAASMLPLEANYLHKIPGEAIFMAKKEDVDTGQRSIDPVIHERLTGRYSKQRYWKQYWYRLKQEFGL